MFRSDASENTYIQIINYQAYFGCDPTLTVRASPHLPQKQTFWNYFVFNVCVVVFISISLRAPCLVNQRWVRIG